MCYIYYYQCIDCGYPDVSSIYEFDECNGFLQSLREGRVPNLDDFLGNDKADTEGDERQEWKQFTINSFIRKHGAYREVGPQRTCVKWIPVPDIHMHECQSQASFRPKINLRRREAFPIGALRRAAAEIP